MNQTKNYKLCQWIESDRILMSDFNNDNQKIEAALTELASGQNSESGRLEQVIANAQSSMNAETARLDRVKSEFTTITTGTTGTANGVTRIFNVSGWSGYSILCMDITTTSGYYYTVKPNGADGTYDTNDGVRYNKGIAYIRGGNPARLLFFPMRDGSAPISCMMMHAGQGFGYCSTVTYNTLSNIQITPDNAQTFSGNISVKITGIK